MTQLETERLILRPFEARDRDALAAINADPQVMRFFPGTMPPERTDAMLARIAGKALRVGYAFAAIERKADGAMIGMCGLNLFEADVPLAPVTEIGWRLTPAAWGLGYASEAALGWLDFGFGPLGLDRIVAFTATMNAPSERVMQRIGMTRAAHLDFDHPDLAEGDPLKRMIVYEIKRP